jgi:O-antigen/teichoic acid export membrane protein
MNFARNAQSVLATQVALAGLGFLFSIVLARWLTVPDRGLFAVVMTFVLIADFVTQLGLRLAVIYRIGRAGVPTARAVAAAFQLSLAAFAIAVAVMLGCDGWLRARFLMHAPESFLYAALVLIALEVFGGLGESAARAIDRFDLRNLHQIGVMVVSVAAAALTLIAWHEDALAALWAIAAGRVALTVVFGALLFRETGFDPRPHPEELRAELGFGLRGYLQMLFGKLHERVDVLLLAWFAVDPAQIAYYAIAVSVIDRLRMVPDSIASALLPKLAVLPQANTGAYTARVTRHTVFWVCVSALALGVLGPPLIPLVYGAPYAASVPAFLVLLPATALLTIRRVVANYFTASGRPGFNAAVQMSASLLNVALNLWAIPRYGILGAAAASLVSYSVDGITTVWVFRRETGSGFRDLLVPKAKDVELYRARLRALTSPSSDA